MPMACAECGALTIDATCAQLFDRLLALDHSRQQPWGSLHGEAVACYFAQHRNAHRAPRDVAPLMARLEHFVAEEQPPEGPPTATIHDVAVDGSFPAVGYRQRLRQWARSILAAQQSDPERP
jgi:hypothetical protein